MQTRITFWLSMFNPFHIACPDKYCSLLFLNYVGRTLELIDLQAIQSLGPYFW